MLTIRASAPAMRVATAAMVRPVRSRVTAAVLSEVKSRAVWWAAPFLLFAVSACGIAGIGLVAPKFEDANGCGKDAGDYYCDCGNEFYGDVVGDGSGVVGGEIAGGLDGEEALADVEVATL